MHTNITYYLKAIEIPHLKVKRQFDETSQNKLVQVVKSLTGVELVKEIKNFLFSQIKLK